MRAVETKLAQLFVPGTIGNFSPTNRIKYGACCVTRSILHQYGAAVVASGARFDRESFQGVEGAERIVDALDVAAGKGLYQAIHEGYRLGCRI
jgi:hypothetical protein